MPVKWFGIAVQNKMMGIFVHYLSYPLQKSHFSTIKASQTLTFLLPADRWSQALLLHLFICSVSPNTPFSEVFFFYLSVSDMDFSLHLCLEGQPPEAASSCCVMKAGATSVSQTEDSSELALLLGFSQDCFGC